MAEDYYTLLGVSREATEAEIKKAFRQMAKECHPDVCPDDKGAEERFKKINEAYSCLSDQTKRANYDRYGRAEGPAGFGGGGRGGQGYEHFGDVFEDVFGDFFGAFTGNARGQRRSRGSDLRYDLVISLEDSAFGKETEINITSWRGCGECGGTGSKSRSPQVCTDCGGRGQVRYQQGFFTVARTCGRCGGTGAQIKDPCQSCKGQGKRQEPRKISVKIPAGVDTGTRLKMTGEGEPGEHGGPSGDLYIVINLAPHEFFQREGLDIYCEVPITFKQAVMGDEIEVPTLEGVAKLKVPSGTQPGATLKMKGKGIPKIGGKGKGDQIVVASLKVPKDISARQRELLEEFDRLGASEETSGFREKLKNLFAGKA